MEGSRLRGVRLLVVEDETLICMLLKDIIDDESGEVVGPVASPGEALALIETRAIDVAIVDIGLFGGSGYAVADALAAHDIPFVFTTGDGDIHPDYVLRPCLEKPIGTRELVTQLEALVKQAGGPSG